MGHQLALPQHLVPVISYLRSSWPPKKRTRLPQPLVKPTA